MGIVDGDRRALLETLTGINASKKNYYPELKGKIKELERKHQQLDLAISCLRRVSEILVCTTSGVGVLLQRVVKLVADLFEANYTVVTLTEKSGDREEQMTYCAHGLPGGAMAAVLPSRLCALVRKARQHEQITVEDSVLDAVPMTTLCAPMLREDKFVGTLCLQACQAHVSGESDLAVVQILADEIAMAIENARLFEKSQRLQAEAERKSCELEKTLEELTQMQEEQILNQERQRIAQELHDHVAQTLTSIGLNLEWCRKHLDEESPVFERITHLKQLSSNGIYEIRHAIFQMSSINIAEQGLAVALNRLLDQFRRITGIEAEIEIEQDGRIESLDVETALYRVAEEALYNVFKHAQASRVEVALEIGPVEIILQVTDNGIGIPQEAVELAQSGITFGIKGMLERMEKVGGSLEISNLEGDGKGSQITARVSS